MAIPTSFDSALPCAHTLQDTHGITFPASFSLLLPTFFHSSNPRRLLPINFSVAAGAKNCPPLPTNPPKIEPDLENMFNDLSFMSDAQKMNEFLCRLFGDPRTAELAHDCYLKAKQLPCFRPRDDTLEHLTRYLIRTKKWDSVAETVEEYRSFNVPLDRSICFRLVARCIRARKFKVVASILAAFESGEEEEDEVAVAAFCSAMKGYNKLHMYTSTIDVHERMESLGIALDSSCLYRIMEAHSKIGNDERVVKLFKESDPQMALDSSSPFSAPICRILFESLGNLGRAVEAYELFAETKKGRAISPNSSIYSTLICSLASSREVKLAEEVFREATSRKMLQNLGVAQRLVSMYIEEGLVERTLEVVSEVKAAGIRVSDNILCVIVNGYSKRRGYAAAAKVYEELISQESCVPGQVSFASMVSIYCRLGRYAQAEAVFMEMQGRGFDRCLMAYSSMIVMYGKTGRPDDAMKMVARMKERGCQPNIWIYNALLEAHGRAKNLRQVERIWREMRRRKVAADRVSYTTVIGAYSRSGEVEECVRLYGEYRAGGGRIDRAMAGIMVGVFLKMGRAEELVKLFMDMKSAGTALDGRLYWSASCALRDAGMPLQAKWLQENFGCASEEMEVRGRGRDGGRRLPLESSVKKSTVK